MNIALVSIAGIILGAALQYIFTRVLEDRRHRRDLRTQAYADYLRAVSDSQHLSLESSEAEIFARLTDAKARICLYGSRHVLELIAEFERLGAQIRSEDQSAAFVGMISAMRESSDVSPKNLRAVILGPDDRAA